jgi:hypothetical protein
MPLALSGGAIRSFDRGDQLISFGSIAMKYVKRVLILYAVGPPLVVVGSIAFCLIKATITGDLWLGVGAVAMALFIMSMVGTIWFVARWIFGRRAKWGPFSLKELLFYAKS